MRPFLRQIEFGTLFRRVRRSGVRRRSSFLPDLDSLESRRLLSVQFSWLGYTGTDLTGPTAAPGPDGTQDLHIQVTGLPSSSTVSAVTITGPAPSQTYPSGFSWTYGITDPSGAVNPTAGASVQVLMESSTTAADVYFSPIVQQINSRGQISDATLPSNSSLAVTVTYDGGQTANYTFTGSQTGATDPAPVDVAPTLPALSYPTNTATFVPQNTTTGDASITLTGLPGGSTTLTNVVLSDEAGLAWEDPESYGRYELGLSIAYQDNNTQATITFPPYRDEAGSTMTLSYQLSSGSTEYVEDIAVPSSDHTYRSLLYPGTYPISSTPLMLSPGGSENLVTYTNSSDQKVTVDIQTLLNDAVSGTYNNFEFTAGTYQIDEVLDLQAPMILQGVGSSADVEFMFSSTSQNPSSTGLYGAINIRSSHVTLENFAISFGQSSVDLGPTNEPGTAGIIDAFDVNAYQQALVDVNVTGLTIHAAFDSLYSDKGSYGDSLDPNGYLTMPSIIMGNFDSGTIENNTVYGGTITVQFGPWTVSGNTFVGSVAGTLSPGVFGVDNGHDVTIQNNTATDPSPSADGQLERFMAANWGGYNISIVGNSVSENVGVLPDDEVNATEEILPESFGVAYEGSTRATAIASSSGPYNRRILAIDSSELFGQVQGAGNWTLFILDGSHSGTAIKVTQAYESSGDTWTYFMLASPLPQGTFDFSIASSYNNFTVSGNMLDTSGTVSTALVLGSYFDDVQVNGNTFKGDQTVGTNGWFSQAIRISPGGAQISGASTLGTYNPNYYATIVSMFGVVISGNTIDDPIGGVHIWVFVGYGVPTTYGRTYTNVALNNNNFIYKYKNENIINMGDGSLDGPNPSEFSQLVNGTVEYTSAASYFVDPRDISVTTSGNTINWSGVSPPASDVQIDATKVNGVLYDSTTYATSTSPPLLQVVKK